MSTEATVLFIGAALALAALLVIGSIRTTRREREECERARAREAAAREEAAAARSRRVEWEARLADQRDAIVHGRDPRGLGDGLGRPVVAPAPSGRFAREAASPAAVDGA